VFAALRSLDQRIGSLARDVCDAAFVPDPKGFNRVQSHGGGFMNFGTNLLAEQPEPEHGALAADLRETLAPVRASIAAGKALGTYVPLAKRPKPYVIKGQKVGLGWKESPPAAEPATQQPAPGPQSSEDPDNRRLRSLVSRLA
jgi:hypothetical protein